MTEDQGHNPSNTHDCFAKPDEQTTHCVESSLCSSLNIPGTGSAERKSKLFRIC